MPGELEGSVIPVVHIPESGSRIQTESFRLIPWSVMQPLLSRGFTVLMKIGMLAC
jgi:hypothetical protein